MSRNLSLSAETEESLRTAIALNRGMEWLDEISKPPAPTKDEEYASLRLGSMEKLFYDTHHQLFRDWNGNNDPVAGDKRAAIREALESVFFSKGKDGKPTGLFDENGFAIRAEPEETARAQFAEKMADFYEKITELQPFSYGNKLALDFFVVAVSKLPVVAEVYPEGVDMRRMDKDDLAAIAAKKPDHAGLVKAFMHATDPAIVHPLMNHYHEQGNDGYRVWDDKTEYVGGVPFLSHTEKNDKGDEQKFLVLMNGGLVPLDDDLQKKLAVHFSSNALISEFPSLKATKYLSAPETMPEKERGELQEKLDALKTSKEISGVKITTVGEAPLVCLDVNIMTGLRPTSQGQLVDFLKKNPDLIGTGSIDKNGNINLAKAFFDFEYKPHENPSSLEVVAAKNKFLSPFLKHCKDDTRMRAMLSVAYDRINANNWHMHNIVEDMFDGKSKQEHPKMYMSMGGSGSGKSIMEKMVRAECGNNFVVSALDSFRVHNDINTLLVAAGHHRDDYSVVDPYATALRTQVIDKAIAKRINILCDGSGINYTGRNDQLVAKFKDPRLEDPKEGKHKFETNLVAIEASYPNAVKRVNARFDSESRAMPWIRAADKHVNFPPSFLDALKDKNLDRISLIASDRAKGEEHLIAETFDKTQAEVRAMGEKRSTGLAATLKEILENGAKKIFDKIDRKEVHNIANIPNFNDSNASFITYRNTGHNGDDRVLAVYDVSRLAKGIEKGLMNPYANSPDAEVLYHTRRDMPFYAPRPGTADGAWQLRVQDTAQADERKL